MSIVSLKALSIGALTVVAFEQGLVERPKPAMVQRLCARRGEIGGVRIRP